MSNVLLEAAATGRPLIASDIPGCREAVDDGKTGFLCQPGDAESLYHAMERFLALPSATRCAIGSAGRKKIAREFDKNAVVASTVQRINDAI